MEKADIVRRTIIRKIKSEKGATLSMALLLFMVCAAVGGVILAAATAAGGRVAKIAEADQRYYNVTSAVQLLAEEISGQEVTIERTHTYQVTVDEDMEPVDGSSPVDVAIKPYKTYVNGIERTAASSDLNFVEQIAVELLFGSNALNDSTGWAGSLSQIIESGSEAKIDGSDISFTMTLTDGSNSLETVDCTGYLQNDGTMVIDVKNHDGDEKYTLGLYMKPNVSETQDIENIGDAVPVSVEAGNAAYNVTETVTKSSTISWYVGSIEEK